VSNPTGSIESPPFWDDLGVGLTSLGAAKQAVLDLFRVNEIPGLVGEAGIGKTDMYKQIARDHGWGYLAMYTQLSMPEDIVGLPFRDPTNDAVYRNLVDASMWHATQGNPEGILVFEEVNRASQPTANAVFAYMDNRGAGGFQLPPGWKIAIAQNPSGGDYAVNDLEKDHAFRRRVSWIAVRTDVREWLAYAEEEGYHPHVLSYIRANPIHLLDEVTRAASKTYANPAAWERVSDFLKAFEEDGLSIPNNLTRVATALQGKIGIGVMETFTEFMADDSMVLSPSDVLESYNEKGSSIAKRVKRALTEGHVDKVTALLGNLVRDLYSYRPTISKELASHLGKFISDMPDPLRATLFNEFRKAISDDTDKEYLQALSRRLALDPNYMEAVTKHAETVESVEEEVSGI